MTDHNLNQVMARLSSRAAPKLTLKCNPLWPLVFWFVVVVSQEREKEKELVIKMFVVNPQ